jgi:hypothetical protein
VGVRLECASDLAFAVRSLRLRAGAVVQRPHCEESEVDWPSDAKREYPLKVPVWGHAGSNSNGAIAITPSPLYEVPPIHS